MRLAPLLALFALVACATLPNALPSLRYADAASRGTLAAVLAGRPTADQVDRATDAWSMALGDSVACGVSGNDVVNAGLVGALEIAAMNAAANRGGEREVREGVGRYLGRLVSAASDRRPRPSASRCDALDAWAPRIATEGRETVARARRNGLMDEEYGLLLQLLSH